MPKVLYYPLKPLYISQGFSGNSNGSYERDGLFGHPALDMVTHNGDTIRAVYDGLIYRYFNKDNPDLSRYRAVCQLIQIDGQYYELTYGHVGDIIVPLGPVKAGAPLAREGNTGEVYTGNPSHVVTTAEKQAGSVAGTHTHFQMRTLERYKGIPPSGTNGTAKEDGGWYMDADGYTYIYPTYTNGYLGCIDPTPFFNGKYAEDLATQGFTAQMLKIYQTVKSIFRR